MLYPWRHRATNNEETIVAVVAGATTPVGNIKPDQLGPL
jgi:hypothetical protein